MKKTIFGLLVTSVMAFTACNQNETKNEHAGHESQEVKQDTTQQAAAPTEADVKTIAVTYTNVDPKAASSIKDIIEQYLAIKNALAADKGNDAATSGKAMFAALSKLDKSLLSAEQKTAYDKLEEEMKEHAEHIGKSAGKIDHQRSHFASLSEVVYELAKNFGAGKALYHDHCPMARDNQGAMWISEIKDVKNPYFGAEMPECGSVEEVIQ